MLREGVILAAGLGRRLRGISWGKPKFIVELEGYPLIVYPIAVLASIGIRRFTIVVPQGWSSSIREILEYCGVDYYVVENNAVERENGFSLALVAEYVGDDVLALSMCDHLYVPEIPLSIIRRFRYGDVELVVGGDRAPLYINVDEATKILTDKNCYITAIGKELKNFTYIDTGVYVITRSILKIAQNLAKSKVKLKLSDVVEYVKSMGISVAVADVTGSLWTEIDTENDYHEVVSGYRRVVLDEVLKVVGKVIAR
ncbi:MAG TPA: hypothetical protein EYH40_02265 [Desulfurococcales archaeon]|nr:hypothetical protein [Desulfurococcales archaeon]